MKNNIEKNSVIEIPFPKPRELSILELQDKFSKGGKGALTGKEFLRLQQYQMQEDKEDNNPYRQRS